MPPFSLSKLSCVIVAQFFFATSLILSGAQAAYRTLKRPYHALARPERSADPITKTARKIAGCWGQNQAEVGSAG